MKVGVEYWESKESENGDLGWQLAIYTVYMYEE